MTGAAGSVSCRAHCENAGGQTAANEKCSPGRFRVGRGEPMGYREASRIALSAAGPKYPGGQVEHETPGLEPRSADFFALIARTRASGSPFAEHGA